MVLSYPGDRSLERQRTRLKYPLSQNVNEYGGRIEFSTFDVKPPDIGDLGSQVYKATGVKAVVDTTTKVSGAIREGFGRPGGIGSSLAFTAFGLLERFKDANKTEPDLGVNNVGDAINSAARFKTKNIRTGESCSLYMPQSIVVDDTFEYENINFRTFGSVLAASVAAGQGAVAGLKEATADGLYSIYQAFRGNAMNEDINRAAVARIGNLLPGVAGAAIREGLQTTPNPNIRALFRSVGLRQFKFTFKMKPKTREEAQEITKIIQFFRKAAYPEAIAASNIKIAYKFPQKFKIKLVYEDEERRKEVGVKLKFCYLRNVQTNFNPNAMAFMEDGEFQEIDLDLNFTEEQTLDRDDVMEGY
tara:strand:+ start:20721 stop:21800 length:1080 start_codon:yes stop_codon:yes gene_type:complete